MRQRPPRAGTFALGSRTKLSRKWGSGGVATMGRPHPYQNGCDLSIGANPRRSFRPFWIAPKGARRPSAAKSFRTKNIRADEDIGPYKDAGP